MGIREVKVGEKTLTIHELDDVYDSATGRAITGAWVWDAATVLAAAMASHPELRGALAGRSVVELGAGASGVPGLAAALLGAARVVLTDMAAMVPGLRRNAEANGLGDRVEARELVWGESAGPGVLGQFDVVVMSEVFFDAAAMAALAAAVRGVSRRRGTRVWAASEVRPWTVECLGELEREGFGIVELAASGVSGGESESESESGWFVVYGLVAREDDVDDDGDEGGEGGGGHVADVGDG